MKGTLLSIFALSIFLLFLHEVDRLPLYDRVEQGIYFVGGAALFLVIVFYGRSIFRR